MASVIVAVALVAAGCGSSSKSKSPNTPAGATTPATPSTASTPSTGTSTTSSGKFSPSSLLTSPQAKAVLSTQAEKNGAPAGKGPAFADCWTSKLAAVGVKTGADFVKNRAKDTAALQACNKQLGINVKP
jgi:hypothetical protein